MSELRGGALVGCSEKTFYRWIMQGKLTPYQRHNEALGYVGGYYIKRSDLEKLNLKVRVPLATGYIRLEVAAILLDCSLPIVREAVASGRLPSRVDKSAVWVPLLAIKAARRWVFRKTSPDLARAMKPRRGPARRQLAGPETPLSAPQRQSE